VKAVICRNELMELQIAEIFAHEMDFSSWVGDGVGGVRAYVS